MLDTSRLFSLKNSFASKPMVGIETAGGNTLIIVNTPAEVADLKGKHVYNVDGATIDSLFPGKTLTGAGYQFYGDSSNTTLYYAIVV